MQKNPLLIITFYLSFLITTNCTSQTTERETLYPPCEQITDSRLNIRASAEDFGTIPPCSGNLELYINKNSEVRSVQLDIVYLKQNNEELFKEEVSLTLESLETGIFYKEVSLKSVEGENCWEVQISIQSIDCFAADGSKVACPEIRVHSPDAFHTLRIEDDALNVCSS